MDGSGDGLRMRSAVANHVQYQFTLVEKRSE